METSVLERDVAEAIVTNLPDNPYNQDYQPRYPKETEQDRADFIDAVHEVQNTEAVTTPRNIDRLQKQLAEIAEGESDDVIVITGRCAEPVDAKNSIAEIVEQHIIGLRLCVSALGKRVLAMRRAMGQSAKPRTNEYETLGDGTQAPSWYGDMINRKEKTLKARAPDPTGMVAAAVEARDVSRGLEATLQEARNEDLAAVIGDHVTAAHEALLLPYEQAQIKVDAETGKEYLLSADLPWVGERTRSINGEHVKMLARVENPVGIKLGPKTTPEEIRDYQRILNPGNKPGKLVFMLRFGLANMDAMAKTLEAIGEHAPESILLYDIHGSTKTEDGVKIRLVSDIITEIKAMAQKCKGTKAKHAHNGGKLRLHGMHLETTTEDRLECTDEVGQKPTHEGGVDPQLNRRQTVEVLGEVASSFVQAA
jgi:3-deoxy-7-phosphoheptulonate synthase